jgi:DNA-binding LacI/PurR family transcriptional regulator
MASSIRDVAARAGVGVGTVSRVINDSPGVAQSTRARVEAAIAELSFRPNLRARALSTGRTHAIGVMVPFFTHQSAIARMRGIVEGLDATEYDVLLFNVGHHKRSSDFMRTGALDRVDGLLIVSLNPRDDEVAYFARTRVPVVLVDAEHLSLPRVVTDDVEGGRLATEHLIALGHRRIAFVGDEPDPAGRFTASIRRLEGYRQALTAAGLPCPPELTWLGPHDRDDAELAAQRLLDLPEPPTGVFVAADTQAIGLVDAVTALGLRVPADLSVIGFDDLDIAAHAGLTTVRQPLHESGLCGARLLLAALAGRAKPPVRERLGLEVVERRTTAAPYPAAP